MMTTHADDDGIIDDGPLTELWLTDSPHTVASSGSARFTRTVASQDFRFFLRRLPEQAN